MKKLLILSLVAVGIGAFSSKVTIANASVKNPVDLTEETYVEGAIKYGKYYKSGTANISYEEKDGIVDRVSMRDGYFHDTDYTLQGYISDEEYITTNQKEGGYYIFDENDKMIDFSVLEKSFTNIVKGYDEEIASKIKQVVYTPMNSDTDEMWFSFAALDDTEGPSVNIILNGYISENNEMLVKNDYNDMKVKYEEVNKKDNSKTYGGFAECYISGYFIGYTEKQGEMAVYDKKFNIIGKFEAGEEVVHANGKDIVTKHFLKDTLSTYEIQNNKLVKINEIKIAENTDIDIAINGEVWTSEGGKISVLRNGVLEHKYTLESDMYIEAVYDENNILFVGGFPRSKNLIMNDGEIVEPVTWNFDEGNYYLVGLDNKKMLGWQYVNENWYYMGNDGAMWSEMWINGYYVDSQGSMVTENWVGDYYVDKSGQYVRDMWVGNYYCDSTGAYVKNEWVGNYYCGADGQYVKDMWVGDYYCDSTGAYVKNTWVGNYYCGANGQYIRNSWVNDGGTWYYCDDNGIYLRDTTQVIDGEEYSFGSNGACLNP